MNRFLLSSLQLRLILGVTVLFLASLWGFALLLARQQTALLEQLLSEQQRATIGYVAEDIDQRLRRRLDILAQAASVVPLDWLGDPARLEEMLHERPNLNKLFDGGVIIVKPDGSGAFADYPPVPGRRARSFENFTAAVDVIRTGRPTVGKPFVAPLLGQPVLGFAVPVHDKDGRLAAILAGVSSLQAPDLLGIVSQHRHGKTGDLMVIAPQHDIVVIGSNPADMLRSLPQPGVNVMLDRFRAGHEGSGVSVNIKGVEQLVSGRKLTTVEGWFVVARLPTAEAFAPIGALRLLVFGGALLLSLLVAALAALWVRRALAPLRDATTALDAISAGTAPLQPLPVARQDEVGRLVQSFNRLQQRLRLRETEMSLAQERFAVAFRASPIAASIGRVADSCLIEVNDKWQRDFGWAREELIGKKALGLGIWPDLATRQAFIEALRRDSTVFDHVTRWRRKDGELRDVSISAELIEMNGEPCVLAFANDVTDRLRAERALAESEARNRRIVETANEGIWIIDPNTRVTFVNQRMADMLGYTRDEILGQRGEDFLFPEDLADHREQIAARQQGLSTGYERRFLRKDGSELWTQVSGTPIMNPDCSYGGAFGMFTDISHLKAQQRQLEHIAHYDALTGIPNRVMLADRMQQSLAQVRRTGRLMAVCYVDLDGFKPINDAFGHEAGDRLLVEIAQRLREGLRGGDTVARLGGDEFVLLLGIERREECDTALRRVLDAIAQPLSIAGSPVTISASIGVTLFPLDDADPDTLLRHADQAMYGAKQEGRNRYQLFDPQRDRAVRAHRAAQDRIAAALAAGEFVLHYQPKVNMREGSVVGVEALIRWQHPLRGLLPPADFLPVIEDTDLIVEVGEWVIDAALRQWQEWNAQGLDLTVSVNIAARHLSRQDFVPRLTELLRAHPAIPPRRLELEVLETAALEDIGRVARIIEECRELGVTFALDDFGTGYSSLTYIKRLPADTLKIDQSFVRDMLRDPEDCAIVEGIIGLARVFHRTVVAEGVETVEHGVLLLRLGCDIAQGYGIARPMPAAALVDWVRNWQPDPVWVANVGLGGHSDDLPLAIAAAGHRRWVEEVEACLCDNASEPETDPRYCRFGQWLAGTGQQHYGNRPGFAEVSRLHLKVHNLAVELLAQQRNGTGTAACHRMPELHGARDALLAALPRLIDDSTAS
ncbi:MAG: EAL domain-containing protein [Rhodocyclaceae bacterium]|nr:EAL domain-containing protein [Rhodocyclaceae bacterium]